MLRTIRKQRGLTQNQLAKMIGLTGATISNFELGKIISQESIDVLSDKISKVLEVSNKEIIERYPVRKLDSNGRIALPRKALKKHGLKKGDFIEIVNVEDGILLKINK